MLKKPETKKYAGYMLSFFIPMIVWIIVCIISGIYPFGNKSIMTGDITYQFIDYLSYYKSVILGNNDLTYTFSKTIGGDMAGFSAYYLLSPFNLILLFFSNRMLPLGLLIIIMLKCSVMSLSFNFMLGRLYGEKLSNFIFSCTYALMGYVVVYFQLYAYFDEFILLPLIIIGIHNILSDNGKKHLYIASLFFAICINFYVAWMICIFCVMYFIYEAYLQNKGIKEFISFIISSACAGMMSAVVVVPSLLSLRGEKNSFHLGFYRTMEMTQLFSRLYTNSFKGNISSCLPNIYCGMLIVLLVFFFFMNEKINRKEKIASGLMILFFMINFYINTLNIVWHGLNRPIGFPYRYSFLLAFFLILLSYKGFSNFSYEKFNLKAAIIFAVYFVYSLFLIVRGSEVVGKREILLDAIIIILILSILKLYSMKKITWIMLAAFLVIIQLGELTENLNDSFNYFGLEDINDYQAYIDEVGAIINEIKESDQGFYRLEKYFRRSHNDAMQFGYNGLTHYSSCEKKDVIDYMGRLGFRNNGNWSFYDSGSSAFMDCIFGVKYIISQFDTTGKGYSLICENDNEKYTYINKNALPLVFASSEKALSVEAESDNPFAIQNDMADSINGKRNNLFVEAIPDSIEYENVIITENEDGTTTYNKEDENTDAFIRYYFTVPDNMAKQCLEGYINAPDLQSAEIYRNDYLYGPYFDKYHWNLMDLGNYKSGEEVSIKVLLTGNSLCMGNAYFYYEDKNVLKELCNNIKEESCELNKITSSHLIGNVSVNEDKIIIFSFPYEKSWKVYVDGIETDTQKSLGQLLSIPINNGSHKIELIYKPEGRVAGLLLFIIGIISTIVVSVLDKHNILCLKK